MNELFDHQILIFLSLNFFFLRNLKIHIITAGDFDDYPVKKWRMSDNFEEENNVSERNLKRCDF